MKLSRVFIYNKLIVLHSLGYNSLSADDVVKILKDSDLDKNSSLDFKEFLTMMKKYGEHGHNPYGKRGSVEIVNKTGYIF